MTCSTDVPISIVHGGDEALQRLDKHLFSFGASELPPEETRITARMQRATLNRAPVFRRCSGLLYTQIWRQIWRRQMDKETQEERSEEVSKILKERIEYIQRYYPTVRDAYQQHYDWPDLDPLRHEISLCIMLGLFQAAITLTNHFLESLLKHALIFMESEDRAPDDADMKGRVIDALVSHFAEANRRYDSACLSNNINRACKLGLIAKEQREQLHAFRERFRNAYSHSDKAKTFRDLAVPIQAVHFEGNKLELDQSIDTRVAILPTGKSIIQVIQAEADAPGYFLYLDNLARQIGEKLFGSIEGE